ncbi:hypothetical protein AB0K68_18935 [Streptomyces sp. NPDC050698]
MTYGLLTPDVPLGPFEGVAVTVWSARGKQSKLHTKSSCSYLRSARVTEQEVRLDATTVGRLCPQCTAYGSWARPGSALAIFMNAVTGLGLLYELGRCHEVDEDSYSDEEVGQAASVLFRTASGSEENAPADGEEEVEDEAEGQRWEELQEARHVRGAVFTEWLDALTSLTRVYQVLDLFPWLRSWAEAGVQRKADHLEALRAQAARLVAQDSLVLAAAVSAMEEPGVPADDPVFAPLGTPAEAAAKLKSLWRRWHSKAEDSWDYPREQEYLVHELASGMSGRRKGCQPMLERARVLLSTWEEAARSIMAGQGGERVLVGRVPGAALAERGSRGALTDRLSEWEQGVLASFTVAVDWGARLAVTVRVPEPVAACLLSRQSVFDYEVLDQDTSTCVAMPEPSPGADEGLLPGVFDDTPVHGRRLVTAEHLRALRSTMPDAEQLYAVVGVGTGVEVVALSVLEQRCAAGWQGVILAGARDLPEALLETRLQALSAGEPDSASVWTVRVYDPHDEAFGRSLSAAEGERVLVRLCEGRRDVGQALKSLALARSVPDLRDLEAGGYDDRGHPLSPFTPDVWNGLLAMEQLDLEPFESDSDDDWPGSGLPLGVLASVQAYTTDAAGRYQGRAHSPGCAHRRPYGGVDHHDEMVIIEELLDNKEFDPCSKCGGYAVRRLTDPQVAYYRAAHQLHCLAQRVRARVRHRTTNREHLATTLERLSDLDSRSVQAWFSSRAQARQWRRTVASLSRELRDSSAG